jgi:ankyrin repeat protein
MRSLMIRFSAAVVFRCAAITLIALGCMCLFTACHRNDAGYEFRSAAAKGDPAKVQALLNGHPDLVFSKNKNGATALYWAAFYGHKDVAELLLANKANVNAKDDKGDTPLHWAADKGYKDLAGCC